MLLQSHFVVHFVSTALRKIRTFFKHAGLSPISLALLLGVAGPLAVMLVVSISRPLDYGGVAWGRWSVNAYRELLFEQDFNGSWVFQADNLRILFRSVVLASIATTLCVVLALPTALYIATRTERLRAFLLLLVGAPFLVSLVVRVYGLMTLAADGGMLNQVVNAFVRTPVDLGLLYTNGAIVIGLVYVFFPFMVLPIYASFREFDWALVEAAYVLDATPWKVFAHIILPGCRRGVLAGVGMVFVPALGAYVVSDLLGGSKVLMIGNLVQLAFTTHRDWPFGAALSMILLALVAWSLVARLDSDKSKGSQARSNSDRVEGFSWSGWIACPVLALIYAPVIALIAMSFNSGTSALLWEGWGLNGYTAALHDENLLRAAGTSLLLAGITMLAVIAVTTLTAVALRTEQSATAALIERGIFAPMIVPEIVLAIATLLMFSLLKIELNFWTVLFAHIVFCLPIAYLPVRASVQALDQQLLDASATLGATPWATFWQVTVPNIRAGILAGALLVFVSSLDDFVTTFFVSGAGVITLPTYIYAALKVGITPKINAISTVLVLLSFAAIAPVVFLRLGGTVRRQEVRSVDGHRASLVENIYGV